MTLLVQKFGGTSVADADRIRAVAEHVVRTRRAGNDVVVVVSAMGKTTDDLERLAHDVADEPAAREMDMLLTSGERISIALLCMAIIDLGEPAVSFTGSQAGIVTDTAHRKAKIVEIRATGSARRSAAASVAVVAGFQGVSTARDITTLGRGGSDTTAVALAAALGAEVCEIYTDVVGRLHGRPAHRARRAAPRARCRTTRCSRCRPPAAACSRCDRSSSRATTACPCTCGRASPGSPAPGCRRRSATMEQPIISGVTHDTSEAKVTIFQVPDRPGIAATVFRALADDNVNVDMIEQNVSTDGHTDISFTVPKDELARAIDVVEKMVVEIEAGGCQLRRHDRPGLARRRRHEDATRVSRRRCSRRWPPRA